MIGELLPVDALSESDITNMFELFAAHFDNVDRQAFRRDLSAKDWIVRIGDGHPDSEGVLGFTSLRHVSLKSHGKALQLLYSGDTIVAPKARNATLFVRTWISSVQWLTRYYRTPDLYWLLLVSGFRTYRLLPVFWREFLPSFRGRGSAVDRDRMRAAATTLFEDRYDADAGIVRFASPQICRADRDGIAASRLRNPDVAWFAEHNPGYAAGDELVCWTRLAPDNLTAAGRRVLQSSQPLQPLALTG